MCKCQCKCPKSLRKNSFTREPFGCHRCLPRQKNTGKVWKVQTLIEIQTTRRNFPAFGQKLFWDFFPISDPCVDVLEEPYVKVVTSNSNKEQTLTMVGFPVTGTFALKYAYQTTVAIAYDASADAVQDALEGLSKIGTGNVSVSGVDGGPWSVEFIGVLAGDGVAALKADSSKLADINAYEPVPGLSAEDTKMVECVYGIVGMRIQDIHLINYEWFKTPRKNISDGLELIVYLYFLRGTWRLTLRYSDYTEIGGAVEILRGVAHYTSEESACFLPESAVFTFDRYTASTIFGGVEDKVPGELPMEWPETANFSTVDVGDFFDTVPITPV